MRTEARQCRFAAVVIIDGLFVCAAVFIRSARLDIDGFAKELVLQATTAALMLAPLLRGSVYTLHRSDPFLLGFVLLRFVSRSLAQPANP